MIGDSENDISPAIKIKIPSIAVSFGYSNKKIEDLKIKINGKVNSFRALLYEILKLFNILRFCKSIGSAAINFGEFFSVLGVSRIMGSFENLLS